MKALCTPPPEYARPFASDGQINGLVALLRRADVPFRDFEKIEREIYPLSWEVFGLGGGAMQLRTEMATASYGLGNARRGLENATAEGKRDLAAEYARTVEVGEANVKRLEALQAALVVLDYPDLGTLQQALGAAVVQLENAEHNVTRFRSARLPIPSATVQAVITAQKAHDAALKEIQEARPVFEGLNARIAKLRVKAINALRISAEDAVRKVAARVKKALEPDLPTYMIDPESIPASIVEDARFGLSIAQHVGLLSGDPDEAGEFWNGLGETAPPLQVRLRLASMVSARIYGGGVSRGYTGARESSAMELV